MLDIETILRVTRGKGEGVFKTQVTGVSINSRTIKEGDLFIAIKGDRFDGHDFIAQALKKKAGAILVSQKSKRDINVPVICVKDTTKALGDIAAFYRRQFNIPIIGITGSAGKTTTKDLVAHVLAKKINVLKSDRSENNLIGVPLTLLKLTDKHQCAVVELGTNRPGEIKRLTQIALPDIAILTTIGNSHLEGLKDLNGVWKEKKALVTYMNQKGHVFFNSDNSCLAKIKSLKIHSTSFGILGSARLRAKEVAIQRTHCSFSCDGKDFRLSTPAKHNIYAALAAISCGKRFSINYNDIIQAVRSFKFRNSRFEVKRCHGFYLINDTYNANPVSYEGLIATLDSIPCRHTRVLVCSDMLELGKHSRKLHLQLADQICKSSIDVVLGTGPFTKIVIDYLKNNAPLKKSYFYQTVNPLNRKLKGLLKNGDIVAVKGSRGMKMERVVENLKDFN